MVKTIEVTLDIFFGTIAVGALALGAVAQAPVLLFAAVKEEIQIRKNKS